MSIVPNVPTGEQDQNRQNLAIQAGIRAAEKIGDVVASTVGIDFQSVGDGSGSLLISSINPTSSRISQLLQGATTALNLINAETEDVTASELALLGLRHVYDGGGGNKTTLYLECIANVAPGTARGFSGIQGVLQANVVGSGSSMYGVNWYTKVNGTGYENATGGEINFEAKSGSSVAYKSGWQVVLGNDNAVQGTDYDTGYALSALNGGTTKLKTGFLIGDMNGAAPVSSTGTLIKTSGGATVGNLIDVSSYTVTDALLKATSGHIEMGEISDPSAPASNLARLYVRDNGGGKSQLVVRFSSGAVQVIATEP